MGGDVPGATLHVAAMADLLEAHLPAATRWRATRRACATRRSAALRGYLTGSLDLVFRLPDDRFVLADYKTNRLAAPRRR